MPNPHYDFLIKLLLIGDSGEHAVWAPVATASFRTKANRAREDTIGRPIGGLQEAFRR